MTSFQRKSITHLGTLHGEGTLLGQEGRQLGQVGDDDLGPRLGDTKSANGQIEADTRILVRAFAQNTRASF